MYSHLSIFSFSSFSSFFIWIFKSFCTFCAKLFNTVLKPHLPIFPFYNFSQQSRRCCSSLNKGFFFQSLHLKKKLFTQVFVVFYSTFQAHSQVLQLSGKFLSLKIRKKIYFNFLKTFYNFYNFSRQNRKCENSFFTKLFVDIILPFFTKQALINKEKLF